jgi:hypothetical protein
MSKTTDTHEHTSHEPKASGCGCGGAHAAHQKTQSLQKGKAIPSGDPKREDPHQTDGGSSGCCGGGKAGK